MTEHQDLKLSLRDQPHDVGSVRQHHFDWVAPKGWATEVLELPAGACVPLDVTVTSVEDGVLVAVEGDVDLVGDCVRCLDQVTVPVHIDGTEVYTQTSQSSRARRRRDDRANPQIEVEGDDFDPEYVIEQDSVDLEVLLRDAIFADAPFQPVCDDDCLGICEHCGVRLRDAEPGHVHEFLDPRFAALQVLLDDNAEGSTADGDQKA